MSISFSCAIENNSPPENLEYEQLFNYSNFKILFDFSDMSIIFDSDIMYTNYEDIEIFINNFFNGTHASVSFNSCNGSLIRYLDGILYFEVYTYKEGAITTLTYKIKINSNNRESINNVFRQLLDFKRAFDDINIIEEDDDEEYQSENPEDE